MRKKQTRLGMPSPNETSGTPEITEVSITPPALMAGPLDPAGGKPKGGSQPDTIVDLAEEFEQYRAAPPHSLRSQIHRDRFYQGVWKFAEGIVLNYMRNHNWKGDVTQDAKDITGTFCNQLLDQEEKGIGLFGPTVRSRSDLKGYLNRTIRGGIRETAEKYRKKRRSWLSFGEEAVEVVVDTKKSDWLTQVCKLTKALDAAREGKKKLHPAVSRNTSLNVVLNLALNRKVPGGEVKKLVPQVGVAKRTRQRRAQSLRKDLHNELEI